VVLSVLEIPDRGIPDFRAEVCVSKIPASGAWVDAVARLHKSGKSLREITSEIQERFPDDMIDIMGRKLDSMQVFRKVRTIVERCKAMPTQEPTAAQKSAETTCQSTRTQKPDGTIESIVLVELWDGEELTPEKILSWHKLDPDKWQVVTYTNNIWNAMAGKDKGNERVQMYQSKLIAKPKTGGITFEDIDKLFKTLDREYKCPEAINIVRAGYQMAEVNIADLHLGRLSWHGDTGGDYDYKIARDIFYRALSEICAELKGKALEYITFVWSNDFFNSDTATKTTTAGTPQDTDLRWQKLFDVGVEMLVSGMNMLSRELRAQVRTFYTASNHDELTAYHTIKFLEAWFRNDGDRFKIDTNAKARKYQLYGKTLIGYTHGNEEKPNALSMIMPNEVPKLWGESQFREMHAAHLHSEHAIEEINGVIVRRISSSTAADTWSYKSAYVTAVRKAQTFLYDKERGLMQTINTPV